MTLYRTIVADPPWQIGDFPANLHARGMGTTPCPYPTMEVEEIADLPVQDLADRHAHLYLWTTNQFIEDSYFVARAWGFHPVKMLVWCKAPKGRGLGGTYASATEYILFGRRGSLAALDREVRNWWQWQRGAHSAKPEAFLDMVERISPAPRLELFARRQRLGWDTWGDQAFNHLSDSGLVSGHETSPDTSLVSAAQPLTAAGGGRDREAGHAETKTTIP